MQNPARSCLLTGASAGIGAATALGLARKGFDLGLVARDTQRLEQVAEQCRREGAGTVRTYVADFAVLDEVRSLADAVLTDWPRLDVLLSNAGLVLQHREETVDGFEKVFAVNHLAPYQLTRLLLDRLIDSAPSRVVIVASDAYTFGDLRPEDWHSAGEFKPLQVYGRSKLANIEFTLELARRTEGTGVTVNCVHPGFVSTSLGRDNKLGVLFLRLARPFIKSPEQGAQTSLLVASEPVGQQVTGRYFAAGKVAELKKAYASDQVMAARLWKDSAVMVGLAP